MDENVEPAPLGAHLVEHRLQLSGYGDVDWAGDRGSELLRKRFDKLSCLLVQPGNGEISLQQAKRLGAAVGYGIFVGNAEDERLLPRPSTGCS